MRFIPLFPVLVLTALLMIGQAPYVSSEGKYIAELKCPIGEFIVGVKQTYYWWKYETFSGGLGLGNLSIYCSSNDGRTPVDEKKPFAVWGYEGNVYLDRTGQDGELITNSWEQLCHKPTTLSSRVYLIKYSRRHVGNYTYAVEHGILDCCSDVRKRDNLHPRFETQLPWDNNEYCMFNGIPGALCAIKVYYNDGVTDGKWYDHIWRAGLWPVCCEIGSGKVI